MRRGKSSPLILPALAIAVLVIVVAVFVYEPQVETPAVILPTASITDMGGGSGTLEDSLEYATVTSENVQAVLATLNRVQSYSRTVVIEDFWQSGSSVSELEVYVDGDSALVRTREGEQTANTLLLDGDLYMWYTGMSDVFEGKYDAENPQSYDKYLRSISYEDVLGVDKEDIDEAGYVNYADESCIYVVWTSGSFRYSSHVYVSLATGLLVGAEKYDGNELIYRASYGAPNLEVPSEDYFEPPTT